MKRDTNTVPSRKGWREIINKIKNKMNRKSIIIIIVGLIIMLGFCILAYFPKASTRVDVDIEAQIVEKYANKVKQEKGYSSVRYELNPIFKMAEENHYQILHPVCKRDLFNFNLDDAFICKYDFYTSYYKVVVNETTHLFIKEDEAKEFISSINRYDNKKYEITLVEQLINKETSEDDINKTIEIKKQEYEKRKAEEERKRREEAEKRKQQEERRRAQQSQSNSSGNRSAYQEYAHNLVLNTYGWSEYDFECLVKLWNRESGWNPNAHNSSSGAHGIPQSLPASKMASEGSDYYTNGYTQIRWGLKYIKGRYGSPSAAWAHSQKTGWY